MDHFQTDWVPNLTVDLIVVVHTGIDVYTPTYMII